ncbi:MAG TPA: cell wall-binding repeat-containing protein [Clostridium sp.]|uniref:Cell wall-binding repeat-containing protein n=1 Tax=Clostridium lapidicellarium TaxID=3240931 RepID=A0ABV4DVD0_9CLOT|nr:cell wall-binding repeat-containing protein [uncultured Clostridium sp.]NLU07071.1 cell wall-binding repeat-containing protein [Clostridiales bacterium]HBC96025.1 cell wall-binding repeat-containing protein [Clostridium sp.]
MYRKSLKSIAVVAFMSLILTTALSIGPVKAENSKIVRMSGVNRYATAARVAKVNWPNGSDNVVLVSGEQYADAASASVLAKKLDAPIILTTQNTLDPYAKDEIDMLKPKVIYVIGGVGSISQNIRNELKDNYALAELGGANRYETNVKIADRLVKLGVDPSNVVIASGNGFSDALSAAPAAASKEEILLLADNNQSLTKPVVDFIKTNKSNAVVVGTENVINDTIYNSLGATKRIDGGADRFDTNLKVLDAFKDSFKAGKLYVASASPSVPDNMYADALVASAVAGKYSAPLVLVDKDSTEATNNAVAYIKKNATSDTEIGIVGGCGVISQNFEDEIAPIYNKDSE